MSSQVEGRPGALWFNDLCRQKFLLETQWKERRVIGVVLQMCQLRKSIHEGKELQPHIYKADDKFLPEFHLPLLSQYQRGGYPALVRSTYKQNDSVMVNISESKLQCGGDGKKGEKERKLTASSRTLARSLATNTTLLSISPLSSLGMVCNCVAESGERRMQNFRSNLQERQGYKDVLH